MSTNCIRCVENERTGPDLLCDRCRLEVEAIRSLTGAQRIALERALHASKPWTAAHDDEHIHGELAIRAAELAADGTDWSASADWGADTDAWGLVAKHRGNRIRQLTIAGSLIAAEIDRLQRRAAKP